MKPDPYDDDYYRRWIHELPPLIHKTRDRMIDVHHTILPPTARITPDADALIADSIALENGLRILSPADMICHAVIHLFADVVIWPVVSGILGYRSVTARICV